MPGKDKQSAKIDKAQEKLRKAEERREAEFQAALRRGGARELRRVAAATVHEISGPDRDRKSAVDHSVIVGPLLDPRLSLSHQQRAVGQAYGGYCEEMWGGGSSWRIGEVVDTSRTGGGGYSENHFQKVQMVDVARLTLSKMKPVRYPLGKKRGAATRGRHMPVAAIDLVDEVCLHGHAINFVAITHGWTTQRGGRVVVPDRQKKWLAAAFKDCLDAVGDAWAGAGLYAPWTLSTVETD